MFLAVLLKFSNVWILNLVNKKIYLLKSQEVWEERSNDAPYTYIGLDSFQVISIGYTTYTSQNSHWGRVRCPNLPNTGLQQDSKALLSVTDSMNEGSHKEGQCVTCSQDSGGPDYFLCFT